MQKFPTDHNPGDVFKDAAGHLWVVEAFCAEPTVAMRRVWPPLSPMSNAMTNPPELKRGSVHGAMWEGFTKLEPKT